MGDVIRLSAPSRKARLELHEAVVFLSSREGKIEVKVPSVEDTPENRAEVRWLLKRALDALDAE